MQFGKIKEQRSEPRTPTAREGRSVNRKLKKTGRNQQTHKDGERGTQAHTAYTTLEMTMSVCPFPGTEALLRADGVSDTVLDAGGGVQHRQGKHSVLMG